LGEETLIGSLEKRLTSLKSLEMRKATQPGVQISNTSKPIEARMSAIELKNEILEKSLHQERVRSKNLEAKISYLEAAVSQLASTIQSPSSRKPAGKSQHTDSPGKDSQAQHTELAQALDRMKAESIKCRTKNIKEQLDGPCAEFGQHDYHAYRTDLYKELERGYLPRDIYAKTAIKKAVSDLLYKPNNEKGAMEYNLDQMFIEFLPYEFLRPEANSKSGNPLSE
jgi:hypothetical protein